MTSDTRTCQMQMKTFTNITEFWIRFKMQDAKIIEMLDYDKNHNHDYFGQMFTHKILKQPCLLNCEFNWKIDKKK